MHPHLWIRAETRNHEARAGITPDGVRRLMAAGFPVTVEASPVRAIPDADYAATGATMAATGSWPDAPKGAIICGLKELPDSDAPLVHRHITFGHAFKGQADAPHLLRRFRDGGGALYDLEYLVDEAGRRVAAFGYWAGFAGAAVGVMAWLAQQAGSPLGAVAPYRDKDTLMAELGARLSACAANPPSAIVIGAKGRVGQGASDLFDALGISVTRWDMAETASGGPFPQLLTHEIFVNAVLAMPGIPVFVPKSALAAERALSVIADVSCDPSSPFNPIPVYETATSFAAPLLRVADAPVLDVMAIDNLPSMLPRESSEDFAAQLLPHLLTLDRIDSGIWARARAIFDTHLSRL